VNWLYVKASTPKETPVNVQQRRHNQQNLQKYLKRKGRQVGWDSHHHVGQPPISTKGNLAEGKNMRESTG